MATPQALFKQYLDAGVQFSEMTRDRAEKIVKELVEAGEVRRQQATGLVNDLVDRSRANAEALVETVRSEVQSQLAALEVVTKDAVDRLNGTPARRQCLADISIPVGTAFVYRNARSVR